MVPYKLYLILRFYGDHLRQLNSITAVFGKITLGGTVFQNRNVDISESGFTGHTDSLLSVTQQPTRSATTILFAR
jgi:hypothetical protein